MAQANDRIAVISQNLDDAGCDSDTKERCMTLINSGNTAEILPILSAYRAKLLGSIRYRQKQLDCLDFLIYQIKK